MNADSISLIVNVLLTPALVLITMWVRNSFAKDERQAKREDGLISDLIKRVDDLERQLREVRAELKNRDAEYVDLYKQHTTLRAKYEVLLIDHDKLRKDYDETANELLTLKHDIKSKADEAAKQLQSI